MTDPWHIWNVIYNARNNKSHPPTSPNTAPATQNESHYWSASHLKRQLQCTEQQHSHSNLTKCCACHAKWHAWLIPVTYETHQILRLPRKVTCMIDSRHIWNVIYNARSNKQHPPNSPNIAPATKMALPNLREICRERLKRHLQCGDDPSMIRDPTVRRGYFSRFGVGKITTCRAPAIYPNFTKYCAWHKKWRPNITKCCACHEEWHCNITKCCVCHEKWHSNITERCACPLQHHHMLRLPRKMKFQHHRMLRLPRKVTPTSPNAAPARKSDTATSPNAVLATKNDSHTWSRTWAVTLLSCYFAGLLLYWANTLLRCCYFAEV